MLVINNVPVVVVVFVPELLSLSTVVTPKVKENSDVGFPSVCYEYVLLLLVNKEAAFSQWLNRIQPG